MAVTVQKMTEETLERSVLIWNQVVEDGRAFPQTDLLTLEEGRRFFAAQSYTGCAVDPGTGETLGVYILHPNNVGRCGHLCNASYAVRRDARGRHVGEALVRDCIRTAKELGFGILQFNAVVASNKAALALYQKLGFTRLGVIPGGFCNIDGEYEDIIPHYLKL